MNKRVFDLVVASVAVVVLSPVMLVTALLVRIKLGRPVLFRQVRPGLHGELFEMVKFRTMLGGEMSDDERLTSFGRALRATSLDELPELFHVISGEMSLVGPRPLLVEYLPLYSAQQHRRHEAKPGLTGLAQALGRNSLDWPTRLELDVEYVDSQSFLLDLKILWWTVREVVTQRGVSAEGQATVVPFGQDPPD